MWWRRSGADLIFGSIPVRKTWRRDLGLAKIPYQTDAGLADMKATRQTFNSHLIRAGIDPMLTVLLMRHSPKGGASLTFGVYGDQKALLARKRQAVDALLNWYEAEAASKCSKNAALA